MFEEDFLESLERGLEKNRLSPELKAQLLADLDPPEERERQLRDLIEHGGMSSEELFESLGIPLK